VRCEPRAACTLKNELRCPQSDGDASPAGDANRCLWPGAVGAEKVEALAAAAAAALGPGGQVVWLPDYGCALLALAPPEADVSAQPLLDQRHLHLLGLDGWAFQPHRWVAAYAALRQSPGCLMSPARPPAGRPQQ
jgi:hypothetical protein